MAIRWPRFAAAEIILAGAILAIGVPVTIANYDEMVFFAELRAATGVPAQTDAAGGVYEQLNALVPPTANAANEFAFALRAAPAGRGPDKQTETARLARTAEAFRDYLARAPADGRAWAGLASVELRRRDLDRAALALKMSVLTAPWSSPLLVLRCGMAMDLFRILDADERELMKGQFRLAAKRSIGPLVDMAQSRGGIRVARILLASSPDELISFETELSKRK